MGGRGSAGGKTGSGGGGSAAYKEAFKTETSDLMNFAAAPFLDKGATKEMIGYEMYVHKSVTGQSLIAATKNEISELRRAKRENAAIGKSYGLSNDTIKGISAGISEKIKVRTKAIQKMEQARSEYEKYAGEASKGNARAKRRKGNWM